MGCSVRVASGITNSSHGPAFRRIVAAVLLLLFASANYAVQTHIHGAFAGTAPAAGVIAAPAGTGDHDTDHCPLCQEFLSSGHFLSAAAPLIALPVLLGFAPVPRRARRAVFSAAHGWQSRAPPAA